jgi:hypothetical protein
VLRRIGGLSGLAAHGSRLGALFAFDSDFVELLLGQPLDANIDVLGGARADELVELRLDSPRRPGFGCSG